MIILENYYKIQYIFFFCSLQSTIISEFLKFTRLKRSLAVDELEVPWLEFLTVFTYFPEGQALIKAS